MTYLHPEFYDFDLFVATFEATVRKALAPLTPTMHWDLYPPNGKKSIFEKASGIGIRLEIPEFPEAKLYLHSKFGGNFDRIAVQTIGLERFATKSAEGFCENVFDLLADRYGYKKGLTCIN